MRGREVSTTSPRLASTRMFWITFSSSASCRRAKAGSLRGGRWHAWVSAATHLRWASPLASVLYRLPLALGGFSLNSPPSQHLSQFYRRSCPNFTDLQSMTQRDQGAKCHAVGTGEGVELRQSGFSSQDQGWGKVLSHETAQKELLGNHTVERKPQSSPRKRQLKKRWYFAPGSRKSLKWL